MFRLRFGTRLEGPCVRCLTPAALPILIDAQEYQATDPAGDDELRSEYVVEGDLDVGAGLATSSRSRCPTSSSADPTAPDSPRLRQGPNVEPHEHDDEPVDPRWAALETLRGDASD